MRRTIGPNSTYCANVIRDDAVRRPAAAHPGQRL